MGRFRKLIISLMLLAGASTIVVPQNQRRIDSLKKVAASAIQDSVRVKSLNALAKLFWVRKPDTSLVILKDAITIAKKCGDEYNLNASYIFLGYTLGATSQFDSALKAYSLALGLSEKIKNLRYKGMSLSGTGNIHYLKGEYQKAVPYYIQALKAQEACNDSAGLCRTYNSLGALFEYQGDYKQALNYHMRSLAIKERMKDVHAVGISLNNIGIVYMSMGDYDKAGQYLQKALQTRRDLNDYGGIAF